MEHGIAARHDLGVDPPLEDSGCLCRPLVDQGADPPRQQDLGCLRCVGRQGKLEEFAGCIVLFPFLGQHSQRKELGIVGRCQGSLGLLAAGSDEAAVERGVGGQQLRFRAKGFERSRCGHDLAQQGQQLVGPAALAVDFRQGLAGQQGRAVGGKLGVDRLGQVQLAGLEILVGEEETERDICPIGRAELAKPVQQLVFATELLQHVGQQLVRELALGQHVPVETGLQFGQRFRRTAAAGGDAGQIKVQHDRVRRQGVRLAEGRLGSGKAVGHEERLAQRLVGRTQVHVQQRQRRIAFKAQALRMIEDLQDTGRLVGSLLGLAGQTV